jgi:hypothetical protein
MHALVGLVRGLQLIIEGCGLLLFFLQPALNASSRLILVQKAGPLFRGRECAAGEGGRGNKVEKEQNRADDGLRGAARRGGRIPPVDVAPDLRLQFVAVFVQLSLKAMVVWQRAAGSGEVGCWE